MTIDLKSKRCPFQEWPKIPRLKEGAVTITEKIDGTNACIIIQDNVIVGVQSRKRLIYPENDNYGFAGWVNRNSEDILRLGEGRHYGEWAGLGIQKNPMSLLGKRFFLFNVSRYDPENLPYNVSMVPHIYTGPIADVDIPKLMSDLKDERELNSGYTPEGIIVYHHNLRCYEKATYQNPQGKYLNDKG